MNRTKFYPIFILIVIILFSSTFWVWAEKGELTSEEKQWLSEHKIIKIAPDPYFPPIEQIDKDGNYVGISAEFMKIIEKELGIKFQVVPCKDWEEVLQKAKNREVDMLPAAAQTPQRAKYMLFSSPYLEFPGVIINRKDSGDIRSIEQLYDQSVAIVSGYVWEDFFRLHHPEINIIPVNTLTEGLRKVSTGAVEVMIGTFGHQQRVSQLAVRIAQEMKLPEDKIEGIRIASLIHDIGKIGLPTEILTKPTKLSDIELNLIKGHSQIGYDILKSIDFHYPIAQIVRQHHERLDGSGYPQGLKDGEILLEARIIGVADVVEAMSSHRPYRPALGTDKALEEISQNKGILYDPEVVDICLKLFREKGFKI